MKLYLLFLVFMTSLAQGKSLLIIHSYNKDLEWVKLQQAGIDDAFNKYKQHLKGWKKSILYLNSKGQNDNDQAIKTKTVRDKIVSSSPDLVITTDDFAFNASLLASTTKEIPLVFMGVNGNPSILSTSKKTTITGILERYKFEGILNMLTKQEPSLKELILLYEPDITGQAIFNTISEEMTTKNAISRTTIDEFHTKSFTEFETLKKYLLSLDRNRHIVIAPTFYSLKDKQGLTVSSKDVDKWITNNTNLIDIGLTNFAVRRGRLLSLSPNGYLMSKKISESVFRLLSTGNVKDLNSLDIIKKTPLRLELNHSRASKVKFSFSYDMLVFSNSSQFTRSHD